MHTQTIWQYLTIVYTRDFHEKIPKKRVSIMTQKRFKHESNNIKQVIENDSKHMRTILNNNTQAWSKHESTITQQILKHDSNKWHEHVLAIGQSWLTNYWNLFGEYATWQIYSWIIICKSKKYAYLRRF